MGDLVVIFNYTQTDQIGRLGGSEERKRAGGGRECVV